jgi:pantetheine-phosphate adenylyltransferase
VESVLRICPVCENVCSYNSYFKKIICSNCGWSEDISQTKRKAVYAGSFDPFTNGHLWVVKEATQMFDKVYICIANNFDKKRHISADKMKTAIEKVMISNNIQNVEVFICQDLIADFTKKYNVDYLVRGLRNTSDYLYEENIAKINFEINPSLKTVYYRANNDIISSSLVRELITYGKDISKYVPREIEELLNSKEQKNES